MNRPGWRRLKGCFKLQVIFCKRATNYRVFCGKWPMKIRHPVTQRHPIIGLFSNDSFEKKIDILMSFREKKTQFLSSNRFKPHLLRNRVCSNEFGRDYRVCQVCVRGSHVTLGVTWENRRERVLDYMVVQTDDLGSHFSKSISLCDTLFYSMQAQGSVLQCVAVCCSVLQCVAVCCSVLSLTLYSMQAQGRVHQLSGVFDLRKDYFRTLVLQPNFSFVTRPRASFVTLWETNCVTPKLTRCDSKVDTVWLPRWL